MNDQTPKPASPDYLEAGDVDELLAQDDRRTIDVYVPEWKKTVRIRQLSAAESIIITELPKNEGLTTIVSLSCVGANGGRLFKDSDALKGKSAAALSRIQDAALKLNGFTTNAVAAAKNG